jgi:hypothetical protein
MCFLHWSRMHLQAQLFARWTEVIYSKPSRRVSTNNHGSSFRPKGIPYEQSSSESVLGLAYDVCGQNEVDRRVNVAVHIRPSPVLWHL